MKFLPTPVAVRFLLPVLLLTGLAGCGVAPVPRPILQNDVSRSTEQDGRFIALVGPRRQHDEPFLGVPSTNIYALRSWVDTRNGQTVDQLYVESSYFGDERNWDTARDATGQELRFIPISKNEITCSGGCSYAEEFAAALPEPLLRAGIGGLQVSFTAKSGASKMIFVPGDLVAKQLAAVDAARASLSSAAALNPAPATEVPPPMPH
ncbi:MAG TPA: hypothetical protein VHY35_13655 [Stellaceae bacterium]|jgi:hypothetical protein|nr:hypothetical protein [Stellaceae bacterium]